MASGKFINFCIDYATHTDKEQAALILAKVNTLITAGSKGALITYSANYSQTVTIEETYKANEWNTHTSGANQASVMREMLSLLGTTNKALQGKMRIAPITTMPGGTIYAPLFSKEDFHLGIVVSDLVNIKAYLEAGWDVLGWQNQDTVGSTTHPYAVGGGVKANLPKAINDMIQNTLIGYHNTYK